MIWKEILKARCDFMAMGVNDAALRLRLTQQTLQALEAETVRPLAGIAMRPLASRHQEIFLGMRITVDDSINGWAVEDTGGNT